MKNERSDLLLCRRKAGGQGRVRGSSQSGNIFFTLFAAVAMLGAVAYGFNTVLRGPVKGMTDVTKRTLAENTVITSGRMAIVGATTLGGIPGGDCDSDGKIEPLPYFDAGTGAHPVGGGWLPRGSGPPAWTLVPDSIDPWKNEYGYCAWDSGSLIADAGCGGATGRLAGSPNDNRPVIAIISAGKDRIFQTTCSAYNITSPNASLVTKAANSDDIVLVYTYAEANNLGNDLWKPAISSPATTSQADKSIAVTGGGTFSDKVVLSTGGLVLPGDPGDDSITGACNAANDKQMRRNTSTIPPTLEICDFTGGLGWNPVSGSSGSGGSTGSLVAHWKLDESSGTVAVDSAGGHTGIKTAAGTWMPTGGSIDGALDIPLNAYVSVAPDAALDPTAFTISFWMKRNGASDASGTMVGKRYNAGNSLSYGIAYDNSNFDRLDFVTRNGGSADDLISPAGTILDGAWTYVTATFDPAAAAPQKKLFINGTLVSSKTLTTGIDYTSGSDTLFLGATNGAFASYAGMLDDVRFYNYALTDTEISDLYNTTKAVLNIPKAVEPGKLYGWGGDYLQQLGNGPDYSTTDAPVEVLNGNNFIQSAGAEGYGCGVTIQGKAYCWGDDTNGKLGNGASYGSVDAPTYAVANLSNVKKVATGFSHACALLESGEVWCWGKAASVGALGDGVTTTTSEIPVLVAGNKDYVDLSVGPAFSCAVRQNGEAWCWGLGTSGQLGNGANSSSTIPVKVSAVSDFLQISSWTSGGATKGTCAVTKSGRAYCWGSEGSLGNFANGSGASGIQNTPTEVTSTLKNIAQISLGAQNVCVLRTNGEIWCAGEQSNGRLGNGLTTGNSYTLVKVLGGGAYTKVATAEDSSCGLRDSGEIWCWGKDDTGQLGNGPNLTTSQSTPTEVLGTNYIDIFPGTLSYNVIQGKKYNKSAALDSASGRIAVSGNNANDTTCFIDSEGSAWCWGEDGSGQLGNGTQGIPVSSPSRVISPDKWSKIGVTGEHGCGIKRNGTLWCWGNDGQGQLGNGAVAGTQLTPYQVGTGLWTDITVSAYSSCGIMVDGTAWCWGQDNNGVLGNGATTSSQVSPVAISETGPWKKISLGITTACAIKVDGSAWCWGSDVGGSVGNGAPAADVDVPVQIKEPGPWRDISAGQASCGVKEDGTGWCWGDTTVTYSGGTGYKPSQVYATDTWLSISSANNHICGIKSDGSAWCWGSGGFGKLGNGLTTNETVPKQVLGGGSWIALEVGNDYTCGIKSNESYWCWGNDANGKLGNGPAVTGNQKSPYRLDFIKGPKWPIANSTSITSFGPPNGAQGINIGAGRAISEDGTAGTKGFLFDTTTPSLQSFMQSSTGSQLKLETSGAGPYSPQIGFKKTQNTIGKDNIPGLIARWKLDESSGTTAVDMIGGNNGTTYNTVTWAPAGGKLNGSAYFDGSSTQPYITVPRSLSLEPRAFTISFWMRSNGTLNGNTGLVAKDYPPDTGPIYSSYAILAGTNNQIRVRYGYLSTYVALDQVGTITPNTWVFVTGSYDPAAATNNMKLYIDGVLNNTRTSVNPISYTNAPLYIGAIRTPDTQYYSGDMDDVRIYDRQLTDAEVTRLYNSYAPGLNIIRSIGLDYVSGSLEFIRNGSGSTSSVLNYFPDLEISNTGNVGLGTKGSVYAKADVAGAVKIGNDGGACSISRAGTIDYNSGSWQYCSSFGWRPFGTTAALWDSVAAGRNFVCATKTDGTLWCWGKTLNGQVGNGTTTPDILSPVKVHTDTSSVGWSDWKMVSTGSWANTCGIRVDGSAWCWGYSANGSAGQKTRPSLVRDSSGASAWYDWVKVDTGALSRSCGIRVDGSAWCWGNGGDGGLGDGGTSNTTYPVQVKDSAGTGYWTDWVSLTTNGGTCGVRANGTAWCWGLNVKGQIGNNSTTQSLVPAQVMDNTGGGYWTDWVYVDAGNSQTCGLRSNGTAWCWGEAVYSRNANTAAVSPQMLPIQVMDDTGSAAWSDWISIQTAQDRTCGIRSNGTAWCWGRNNNGEIGNNTTGTTQTRPKQVMDNTGTGYWTDWVSISAAYEPTCGLRVNGTAWCWGTAVNGGLGNGQSSVDALVPVQVQ